MVIYVDFDDVICETARALSCLADHLFGRKVAYAQIRYFHLEKSFNLSPEQLELLMAAAHEWDFLTNLSLTPGADCALRTLKDKGHDVQIVTGRPSFCHAGTDAWLCKYALSDIPVVYVDKYGRGQHGAVAHMPPLLSLAEFNQLHYDVAIDDSPVALDILTARTDCQILVFDRPWNQAYCMQPRMARAFTWPEIVQRLASSLGT